MTSVGLDASYGDLNIGGRKHVLSIELWLFLTPSLEVVSTLHQRPYKTTHINTVRAQRIFLTYLYHTHSRLPKTSGRAHAGKSTKSYITTSRKRMHQMVYHLRFNFRDYLPTYHSAI